MPDLSKALVNATPELRREVFDAFRLRIELDRNAGQIRLKALVSSAFSGMSLDDLSVARGTHSGGRIRTCDLRVMSPTSYLAAPPRGGHWMVAMAGGIRWLGRGLCTGGFAAGLALEWAGMAAGSKRVAVIDVGTNSTRLLVADVERGTGLPGRAAQHGDAAGPGGRPLGAAVGRGDRGRLRGDRRVRRTCCGSWGPGPWR